MNINQTTASTAMILLNAPNMLPIRVGRWLTVDCDYITEYRDQRLAGQIVRIGGGRHNILIGH